MEEIDLKEIINSLWKRKIIIIIITLLFAIITFLVLSVKYNLIENIKKVQDNETLYYAQTNFIVGTEETLHAEYNNINQPFNISGETRITQTEVLTQTYFDIIKSKESLRKIINELNLNIDENTLSNLISFSYTENSDMLSITVAYTDEDTVIKITNKLMIEFTKNMKNAYSMDKVSIIDKAYLLSNNDIANSSAISNINTSSIAKTTINHIITYTFIITLIGFIILCSIILFIGIYDNTIKSEDYFEKNNLLDKIEKNKNDNNNKFDILNIRLSKFKTILITSVDGYSDTTYISNNLATSFARNKDKVLLIDLVSDESELAQKYDIIIINSNNILNKPNSLLISKIQKNTLFVVTEMKTKMKDLDKANKIIEEIDGNDVGNILIV